MTLRTRVALGAAATALLPLLLLGYGVRREMTSRLVGQADARVEEVVQGVREQTESAQDDLAGTLGRLAADLADDNRFRSALAVGEPDGWLLDWAAGAMRNSGLDLLELLDSSGVILSSGHFRNEYGQRHPGLPRAIEGLTFLEARTPDTTIQVLARAVEFGTAGRTFALVGGRQLTFAPSAQGVSIQFTAPPPDSGEGLVALVPARLVSTGESPAVHPAAIVIQRDMALHDQLRRGVDRWMLFAALLVLPLAAGLAVWIAARVSRPLEELAAKTSQVDLDRLDQRFTAGGTDEVASLAGLLDAMTGRLRASAVRLAEIERRNATGDLARQVNHDIKNGLVPIRHILRHLEQVAREQPVELARTWKEREASLVSSVEYLEQLSRNYARLSPALTLAPTDPSAVVHEVAQGLRGRGAEVSVQSSPEIGLVQADPVALRRILENLGGNAVDAALEGGHAVEIRADRSRRDGAEWIRLTVTDNGPGMSESELQLAFDDFHTTRAGGTGLGLSVTRRLVTDLGGRLRVETTPGKGSRFIVELPAVAR